MRGTNGLLAMAAAVLIAACAPSARELRDAAYGPRPSDEEAQRIVRAYFDARLKDPYSARWAFTFPLIRGGWYFLAGRDFGWVQCGTINAKNSYGGYIGRKHFFAVINRGRVVFADLDGPGAYRLEQECRALHGY